MFRFQNEQHVFSIGGVSFGGQPGKRRSVLVGSLFYPRHSAVLDRVRGKVDEEKVARIVAEIESAADATGTPAALMLYAETPASIASYLDKVSDMTELPVFIDSPSPEVRLSGARRAAEMGVQERTVYNSLSAGSSPDEFRELGEIGLKAAVLLAFNPRDFGVKGKIYLLDDGGGMMSEGLLALAQKHGIDKPLVDLAVMSMDQNAGSALRALVVSKAKWGLPSGCALHNAVESWSPLLEGEDPGLFRYVDIASTVIPLLAGADFVMYGPAEYARRAFHAAAFADELIAQAVSDL